MRLCTTFVFLGFAVVVAGSGFLAVSFGAGSTATVSSTVTTTSQLELTQSNYRWYQNENALTPTLALATQNTTTSVPDAGNNIRLRMSLAAGLNFGSGLTFSLQYSSSSSSGFTDIGTSTDWIFFNNPGVADGQTIVDLLISGADVGQSYGESNPSAATPNSFVSGEEAEWDWSLRNNAADTSLDWYFRMIYSSGTTLDAYTRYPTLAAVSSSTPPTGGQTIIIPGGGGAGGPLSTSTPPKFESPCDNLVIQRVDLSGNCRVDIVDLSILLYYYGRTGPAVSRYDFTNNGEVDFPDVSVMMFYWTD